MINIIIQYMVTPFFRQTYVTHHDKTSRAYESIAGGQQAFDNVRGLPYPGFAWMSACQPSWRVCAPALGCMTLPSSKVLASMFTFTSSRIVCGSRGRYSMYLLYKILHGVGSLPTALGARIESVLGSHIWWWCGEVYPSPWLGEIRQVSQLTPTMDR